MFTRVLRGHIELTTLAFPEGLNGQHIDMAARRALWDIGCNYLHGTGHGIGHYLNVHEGPISISSKAADVKFAEGHVISNEPGFYKDGAYGIRTENLVAVVLDEDRSSDLQKFLRFETLSRCPIETSLIDRDLLGDAATAGSCSRCLARDENRAGLTIDCKKQASILREPGPALGE
jgi:Xaa-Pro aminopeptidase